MKWSLSNLKGVLPSHSSSVIAIAYFTFFIHLTSYDPPFFLPLFFKHFRKLSHLLHKENAIFQSAALWSFCFQTYNYLQPHPSCYHRGTCPPASGSAFSHWALNFISCCPLWLTHLSLTSAPLYSCKPSSSVNIPHCTQHK